MLWLKRNLVLVIALAVGGLLVVLGGLYVWNKKSLNASVDEELEFAKREYTRLTSLRPTPNAANVQAIRQDVRTAEAYAAESRHLFPPTPYQPLNSQTYRSLLETTVAELRAMARREGTDIPTNFSFSFESQINQMSFEPASLRPLAEQLKEIQTASEALFRAKVHRLLQIRRVAVSQYDAQNASEILTGTTIQESPGTQMTVWPYEFTFECFSAELAQALTELSQIPRMLLVKTIDIAPSPEARLGGVSPAADRSAAMPAPGTPPGTFPPGARRPGFSPRRPGAPVAPKAAEESLTTVLEEHLLRVVMQIHVIKPHKPQ